MSSHRKLFSRIPDEASNGALWVNSVNLFCQPILLQTKCTGFDNGIILLVGKILFILYENSDWKIWSLLWNHTLKSVFNMLDCTKCQFCQPILLQIKCTGFNYGITFHIKSSTFYFKQNRLTELTFCLIKHIKYWF